jgi:hypothetical protein
MVDLDKNVVKLAHTAPAPDPFSPEALRLDQNFSSVAVKKLITTVPVAKPNKQDFVRVHPDPEYRLTIALIELKDDREIYAVAGQEVLTILQNEWFSATLYLTINRQGVVRLWPVKLPAADGRRLAWHDSAAEAAELAMKKWIRVVPNMSLGAYEITEAVVPIPDPEWPALTMHEILKVAFRDRLINDVSHPVVQRLHGLS